MKRFIILLRTPFYHLYKTSFYPDISSWNEEGKSYLAPNLLNPYLDKETISNDLVKALKVEPATNLTYNTKKK